MLPDLVDPDRQFALLHVAPDDRAAVAAVWALDETLGTIVARARDLLVGQMRLTWWHEALATAEDEAPRGQPILDALAGGPLLGASRLTPIVEGWEALLNPLPLPDHALLTYAAGRGATVFTAIAQLTDARVANEVGEGWALADFARRCSDPDTAARAWALAAARVATIPRDVPRPLRILARLAKADAAERRLVDRTRWRLLRAAW